MKRRTRAPKNITHCRKLFVDDGGAGNGDGIDDHKSKINILSFIWGQVDSLEILCRCNSYGQTNSALYQVKVKWKGWRVLHI